ncbi:MAG: 16S rRNA (adenine(1518)-N(6)/adenine(1519)-N(6))-dimethyltransferase RsmA [Candidatus Thermoplasmatota archaeon]|jgi:16S rRNA (adenine1518-N6/adenine1519-N6)-dimethyltransferase|nr:16S rRNA (adenine(1518)-N(6)/adenine(1519)-N(6))-dimethyltransferase RsmA [Candidatus Thermoplasmatota archaeon]
MVKRKTSQNFLVDRNIAELEVKHADINKGDVVLEIGPGTGILTSLIADKASKVIAVEIDRELVDRLRSFLPENVMLINDDALRVDFSKLPRFNKIISNLPFHISSPITFKFLDYDFELAVLIYQKEFADRMVAKPGGEGYSRLSVGVYYKSFCDVVAVVPKTCFYPQPKVDSSLIKLRPRKTPPFSVKDEKLFFDLTRNLFNHRRKKISTTIGKLYGVQSDDLPYFDRRVEELSPEQIGKVCDFLFDEIYSG